MEEEIYSEEIKEAVAINFDYLDLASVEDTIAFLEGMSESIYESELLEKIVAALRDRLEDM